MEQKRNSAGLSQAKIFTIPNLLSLLRILLIPVIVWLHMVRHNCVLAVGVLLLSGATDVVDGYVARRFHMTSDLGKVLDPAADKLTQVALLICLLLRFPWMLAPAVLMAVKEVFMAVTGFLVIRRKKVVLGADWHGKAATCLLYGMILLHMCWYDIPPAVSALSAAACTLMIAVSFVLYGIRNINALRS